MSEFRPFQLIGAPIHSVGGAGGTDPSPAVLHPAADAAGRGSILPADFTPAISTWPNTDIRIRSGENVAQHGRSNFAAAGRPFWLSVDVDILDPAAFPVKSLEGSIS